MTDQGSSKDGEWPDVDFSWESYKDEADPIDPDDEKDAEEAAIIEVQASRMSPPYPFREEAGIEHHFPEAMSVFQFSYNRIDSPYVQERLEHSIKQRTKMFLLLSETSSDPHFVKDRSLRYVYVNRAMERMLNRRKEAILGQTDTVLYGKTDASELINASNQALQGSTFRMKRTRRIEGKRRLFMDTLIPWIDDYSNIMGIYGTHVDITGTGETYDFSEIADTEYPSRAMRETLEQALLVSKTRSSVLLLGESGCGKDFLARYIHDHSDRVNGPFRSVNCAALPHELVESELFGHEKGAFSGATSTTRGHVELAHRGTLLLNEIGELPLALQSKLLTFLDTRTFTRVGGEKEIKVDVRIIAATNRVLEEEVREQRFRADLFFRLNVFSIRVPSLRQRREDMPILISKLLPEIAEQVGRNPIPEIESSAMKAILDYPWSGNVRELRNALERALIITVTGRITCAALGLPYPDMVRLSEPDMATEDTPPSEDWPALDIPRENAGTGPDRVETLKAPVPLRSPSEEEVRALHEEHIIRGGGNSTDMAKACGVKDSTVRKWCNKCGLSTGPAGRPRMKRPE